MAALHSIFGGPGAGKEEPYMPMYEPGFFLGRGIPGQTTEQQIIYEFHLIKAFADAVDHAGLGLPGDGPAFRYELGKVLDTAVKAALAGRDAWPPNELMAMFALAQHYGVPTRLLDWTYKPRVAAYFAAVGMAKRIWEWRDAERRQQLRWVQGKIPEYLEIWALSTHAFAMVTEGTKTGLHIVSVPSATNPNLSAQSGIFTVDKTINAGRSVDVLLKEAFDGHAVKWDENTKSALSPFFPVMRRLTLPSNLAPELLRRLAWEDVTAATVFPGYRGVVLACEERRYWEKIIVPMSD